MPTKKGNNKNKITSLPFQKMSSTRAEGATSVCDTSFSAQMARPKAAIPRNLSRSSPDASASPPRSCFATPFSCPTDHFPPVESETAQSKSHAPLELENMEMMLFNLFLGGSFSFCLRADDGGGPSTPFLPAPSSLPMSVLSRLRLDGVILSAGLAEIILHACQHLLVRRSGRQG